MLVGPQPNAKEPFFQCRPLWAVAQTLSVDGNRLEHASVSLYYRRIDSTTTCRSCCYIQTAHDARARGTCNTRCWLGSAAAHFISDISPTQSNGPQSQRGGEIIEIN
jgi:hypothetical protein